MKLRTFLALFCILTLLLTFTACKPPVSVDSTSNTTEKNTTSSVTESTNTTPTTTEPSSSATELEVQDITTPSVDPLSDQYYPFIYKDGRQPYPAGPELDLSKLTPDCLYVHNKENNEVYLIDNAEVAQMDTSEHGYIYYRPTDNSRIVRSDYTGEAHTDIYTSEKEITWFDYNANKLLIVENKKKMLLIDLATGASEEIMEQYCINEAFYHPDASDFTSEDKGRTIQWYGHSTETDELSCYIYHIDKNEMYVPTWH